LRETVEVREVPRRAVVVAGRDDRVPPADTGLAEPGDAPATPAAAVPMRGAIPQTSQYPSTIDPLQSGRVQSCRPPPGGETVASASPAAAPPLRGATPQTSQ